MCQLRVRRRLVPAVAGAVGLVVGADTGSVGASGSRLRLAGTLSARRGDGEGKGTENSVVWARKKREVAEAGGHRALVECKALGEC